MALASRADRARGDLALVRDGRAHKRRLADQAERGRRGERGPAVEQSPHADAADLFVIAEGELQRSLEAGRVDRLESRQRAGEKPLHVGGSSRKSAASACREGEGVAAPGLALRGHDVGMAGQHEARQVARADRSEEVRLGSGLVEDKFALDPNPREACSHVVDQFEIGARADGRKGDQRLQQRQRLLHAGFRLSHVRPACRARVSPGSRNSLRRVCRR